MELRGRSRGQPHAGRALLSRVVGPFDGDRVAGVLGVHELGERRRARDRLTVEGRDGVSRADVMLVGEWFADNDSVGIANL